MKKINVLILGMGGNVSQGILKAIHHSGIPCQTVGACVNHDAAGLYLCDKAYISPYAASKDFIPWLYNLCSKEKIDILFTGVEEVIDAIAPVRENLLQETGAVFRASSLDKLLIGRDKYLTCQWLLENGFRAPDCWKTGEGEMPPQVFPMIAKPRKGKSSEGVFLIQNMNELVRAASLKNYVIQEYIGETDGEYTVGCYRGLNGFIAPPIIMHRTLKNGTSWKVETVRSDVISEMAIRITKTLRPDGPLNIQLRIDKNGRPVPFEFNVRFSGTTPMRANFGFCDVKAMILESVYKQGIENCFSVKKGVALRYTNELYVFGDINQLCDGTSLCNTRIYTGGLGR